MLGWAYVYSAVHAVRGCHRVMATRHVQLYVTSGGVSATCTTNLIESVNTLLTTRVKLYYT
eukprot:COSAG01_NODE_639_length_14598_cov_316.689841_14_plen_61_part_00